MKIKFASPLFGYSGYATDGRSICRALLDLYPSISIARAWPDYPTAAYDSNILKRVLLRSDTRKYDISIVNGEPRSFPHPGDGRSLIRRMSFETGGLPKDWVRVLNKHDQIWVMSSFNRATFIQAGVTERRIKIIPGAVLTEDEFSLTPLPWHDFTISADRRDFRFLSIFRWQRRKGWDILTKAFLQEFAPDEDVTLVLKIDSFSGLGAPDLSVLGRWVWELGYREDQTRKISVVSSLLNRRELVRLYRSADCFVLPSRGEGWGLPYMEAMSYGLPVIGTNWGGNLDFMNSSNSYLLDYSLTPVEDVDIREQSLYRGQTWAEPSCDHLQELMRQSAANREELQRKAQLGMQEILERFHLENLRDKIRAALES